MSRAIRIHETGGPDVLRWEELDPGAPGPGQALVRQTAVGLNYIDTYHRTGLYPLDLPAVLGMEGAGVVETVGTGVDTVQPGDRVAYAGVLGAYAERRLIPADRLVPLPDAIDDDVAAAAMLKGMTVEYLVRRTYRVSPGETVLWHAAAGGVGLIACQWLAHVGAVVIGTVGSDEKAELARRHGCRHVIVYTRENVVERVREITGGAGLGVVYDSVGKATWEDSLSCLRPRGLMVSFGNASGAVPPFPPGELARRGSLFLTRPTLMSYTNTRPELMDSAGALFDMLATNAVEVRIDQRIPLRDAADAHRRIEARRTTGSTILVPGA